MIENENFKQEGSAEVMEAPMQQQQEAKAEAITMNEEEIAEMEHQVRNLTETVPQEAQSESTKKKLGFFGRLFSGEPSEKALEKAEKEIDGHPTFRNVYNEIKEKYGGDSERAQKYVKAVARSGIKDGIRWDEEKQDYRGGTRGGAGGVY